MSAVLTVVLMIVMLLFGAEFGLFAGYLVWGRKKPAAPAVEPMPTDEEIEAARREREELIASQKAFQTMLGYNADIAYGIGDSDLASGGN